jgi:hypothetical protein
MIHKTREEYLGQAMDALVEFCRAVLRGDFEAADTADCAFIGALIKASRA